ncbi:hypothetical protein [uncultured Dechloromonas sp.]|uniref:hypothetical protein n=1 Tax=uncultured Dechloromonas sp. TaxID=171719 RepID=UPI0025F63594|nr:hypothetical protein [uncultured Dechloromonas sp.]
MPQGGLTCLVHGVDAESHQMIPSLERMRSSEDIDPLTVQAGVTLQGAEDRHDRPLPLDLGARGMATLDPASLLNPGKIL